MKKERTTLPLASLELNTGQIEWLPKNPREWTQESIDNTAKSIEEDPDFLEDRPLLVVPFGGKFVIFCGNLRSEGANKLGMQTAPCVIYYPETEDDREAVLRRSLKDNGTLGKFDWDELANSPVWGKFPLADFGIPVWSTEAQEAGVGGGAGDGEKREAQEDDFDEEKDHIAVRCKKGDIWQLGEHRLVCGDSVDLEVVKSVMGGGTADLLITDPPYGVAIGDKNKMLQEFVGGSGAVTTNIENDTLSVDELYKVLQKAMENGRLNCKDDASYFVFAPPGGDMGLMMTMMMRDAGLRVRHQIVWNKNTATFSLGRLDYDYKHEAIMYTWTKKHHNYRKGEFRTSVWDVNKPMKCDLHPTMKPLPLLANMMLDGSQEGDIVLDLFGGSGSTLIAAEQMGRKARLVEIDPHYCDVILARWEKATGRNAEKVS